VSRRNLYDLIRDGRFPVLPIPGTKPRRWATAAVDAWMRGESAA
jgi:predicted DNA-binding transcriptional regulator AlpA